MENILNIIDPLENEFEDDVQQERFKITNLQEADWAFRKIKQAKDDLEIKKEYVEAQKFKYEMYFQSEEKSANDTIEFFEGMLREYFEEQRAEDPKFKLKTALGTANITNRKEWDYGNEEELLNFLKENKLDEYVRTTIKEAINKTDLKKAATVTDDGIVFDTSTGEIIQGVKVSNKQTFTVKLT